MTGLISHRRHSVSVEFRGGGTSRPHPAEPVQPDIQAGWSPGSSGDDLRREHREQLGLTAAVVGKTTGIGGSNLSAIESGKRRLTATKLTDLAGVYELSADEVAELDTIRARADQREWYHDYTALHSEEFLGPGWSPGCTACLQVSRGGAGPDPPRMAE